MACGSAPQPPDATQAEPSARKRLKVRKAWHAVQRARGLQGLHELCCPVPDERGVERGVLRLCDLTKELGTKGRRRKNGCCTHKQIKGKRRCYDIMKEHLSADELKAYEKASKPIIEMLDNTKKQSKKDISEME